MALNPPYLFLVVFFCSFPLFLIEKPCFPPKRAFFCLVSVFPFPFSLAFFGLPLFHFLFLCLSLFLFFLPSFLSFVFAFFLFLVFVSFFLFLYYLLLFHEKNNIKLFNYRAFLHQSFLIYVAFLSCFFQIPFPYLCFFLFSHLKFCFLFNINVFFKKCNFKKHQFLVKRGLQHNGFFISLCLAICEKLSFFGGHFCQFIAFQKSYTNRCFSTFFKAKNTKKQFEGLLSGPSRGYCLIQVECVLKTHTRTR